MKDTYRTNHQDQCYQNSTNLWSTLSVYSQLCPKKCYVMQWLGHKQMLSVNIPAWTVIKLTNSHSTYGSPYFQSFSLKKISFFNQFFFTFSSTWAQMQKCLFDFEWFFLNAFHENHSKWNKHIRIAVVWLILAVKSA